MVIFKVPSAFFLFHAVKIKNNEQPIIVEVCVRKQQSCLTRPLHRATLSCCLGHGDLCLGVLPSTCRHVPFSTNSCLVCYATTVKHLQINQRKVTVRLLLGQELYAEQQHIGQSNSAGGPTDFLVFWTAC